jgi:hypothetical protein
VAEMTANRAGSRPVVPQVLLLAPVFRTHGRLGRVERAAFLAGMRGVVLVTGAVAGVASREYSVRMGLPPLRRVA